MRTNSIGDNTDWVRQQVLKKDMAKAGGYEGTGEPVSLGKGWTTAKLAPSLLPKLATTEYVDQQVAEGMDSIRDSMATSAKWVNRRIAEEIAKEKEVFYKGLLNLMLWLAIGMVVGWVFWYVYPAPR
jgi:hypothetical protein